MAATRPISLDFKILPATEADCATIATVESISNWNSDKTKPESNVSRVLFGEPGDASFRAKDLADKLKNDETMQMWKAVICDTNSQEKIVAAAIWHFHHEPKEIKDWEDIEWPPERDPAGCNGFIRAAVTVRRKHMSEKKFGHLQVLATLPEYRGYGIGSALIKHGLDEGMNTGLNDFWLEASNDGHALYAKYGFQDVEPVLFNLEKYGGVGMAQLVAMRRFPN